MTRKLKDSVVVVTGASSGIGRETARQFAEKGATVVVAARRENVLKEVVAECEKAGGHALAVPTDVTDESQVTELAQRTLGSFGRIDVWVNNAAVTLFGKFDETPIDDYRRVVETNLFGYIYGARAALPIFREQGSGVLINVSSVVARVPQPYTSAYSFTKAAIRSLSASLRQELALDGAKNIHVSTVMPATIDTPFFQHAANYTGRKAKAIPPVYPTKNVAAMIVRMVQHPKREVYVGNAGRMLNLQMKFAPAMAERAMATMVDKQHLMDQPESNNSGNLFEPMQEGTSVSGGWQSNGTWQLSRTVAVGLAAIPAALVLRRRHSQNNGAKPGNATKSLGVAALARRIMS